VHRAVDKAFALVLRPTVLGAAYLLALTWHASSDYDARRKDLGDQADQIATFVQGKFGGEISRVTVAVIAAAVVIGAAHGLVAAGLLALRDLAGGVRSRATFERAAIVLGLVAALHALVELWGLAATPQLYAEAWYARGGAPRTIQVIASDVLHPSGVIALGAALAALFVAGPPRAWRAIPSRLRALAATLRKNGSTAAAVAGAGVLVALLPRAGEARAVAADASKPNILILAADSLRADRIVPEIAPTLSKLADRSTRFDRAYVSLPRTFPSWVSILTGRHPHHHGIRNMFPRWEERAKDFDALPERLAKGGYRTGVVSDYAGDIFGRIDLGFQDVDVPTFDFRQLVRQTAMERVTPLLPILHSRMGRRFFPVMREMNDAADASMLTRDAARAIHTMKDRPFFLTLFYSTAHFPYAAPAPYYGRFTDPSYRGRFKYFRPRGLGQEQPPDARDEQQIRGLYDGAVASIDDAAKELLDVLADEKIAENTIVIVTADHGETLYDNGHGAGHGDHLFGDEGTHVPLFVFDPRNAHAARVASVVRDVDIAPTIYDLAGVAPPGDLDGRSLSPALKGDALSPALAYAETGLWFTEEIPALPAAWRLAYPSVTRLTEIDARHGDDVVLQRAVRPLTIVAKHRMVRDERYKLVYVPTRTAVLYMLYDTVDDPAESTDVAAKHPDVVTRLKGELWAWMLRDETMAEKNGYLVPRDATQTVDPTESGALRIGDVPRGDAAP
jgi:arylsulfatase A-like enzyme